MTREPAISDAEWIVMRVLWAAAPLTTNQVVAALGPRTEWKPQTIHTLLARLVSKGALEAEKKGREHLYHPLVKAEDCEYQVSRSFLSRFFDGDLAPFLARFVEKEKLTKAQVEELKRILERKHA